MSYRGANLLPENTAYPGTRFAFTLSMSVLEIIGDGIGRIAAPLTALGSRVRQTRLFHPVGEVFKAEVTPVSSVKEEWGKDLLRIVAMPNLKTNRIGKFLINIIRILKCRWCAKILPRAEFSR